MSGLVDTAQEAPGLRVWAQRAGLGGGMLLAAGLAAWAGFNLSHSPPRAMHQVAKIALLLDTPPPPPPPPPERPKVEQKTEMRQIEKQKMETPPAPEQLKMEGQAGEGPSPFASGDVKNDYIGGDIGNGRFAPYVGQVEHFIQEVLSRHKIKVASARMLLWLSSDGTVSRFELSGAGPDVERELRSALADVGHVPERPPQDMPMPLGLEISQR